MSKAIQITESSRLLSFAISYIETVAAIEMLEYQDSNHLRFDPKRRSEDKRELLARALENIRETIKK